MRYYHLKAYRARHEAILARPVLWLLLVLAALGTVTSGAYAQGASHQSADTVLGARVTGTVYDSVAKQPLAGAQVQFVDAETRIKQYMTKTDSLGRFEFDTIAPGKYIAGFFHPEIDELGIESPLRAVTVTTGAPNVVSLAVPGPSHLIVSLCGKQTVSDSLGAIVGRVRAADSQLPIQGAQVVVKWLQMVVANGKIESSTRNATATTDIDGVYRMCGLPGADTLLASVELGARRTGTVSVGIPAGGITQRDFTLGDSSSVVAVVLDSTSGEEMRRLTTVLHGTSRLSGHVRDARGKGLPDARITVAETGLTATTDSTGRFMISGLPAGTFSVEARAIGREWRTAVVDLTSNAATSIDFTLGKQVQTLAPVSVFGSAKKNRPDIEEFLKRKKSGFGHYITDDDPSLKYAFSITDAIRMVPGIRIISVGHFQSLIQMGGALRGCMATVFVDGIKLNDKFESIDDFPANQIEGIEVYRSALETPPRFMTLNPCGAVVIWRKR